MHLYIKNMVCRRCEMAVNATLEAAGLHPVSTRLGEVVIEEKSLSAAQVTTVSAALQNIGFELIDDKRSRLIEAIKTFVINTIHYQEARPQKNYSELLSKHLLHDYSYLSHLFSSVEGITIEQYIINQKIEKVKELLVYGEQSLSQIAFDMGYSSTAHLSSQFKRSTGQTPTQFKQSGLAGRRRLDEAGPQK